MLPYYVTPDKIDWFVNQALIEDVGSGDHTTLACIPDTQSDKAILKVKDEGIIAGIELAKVIIQKLDPNCSFTTFIKDGDSVSYGDIAFELSANSHALLKAERLILNTMQRMSGIATMSNRFAFEVEDLPVTILDTRKTTPLLRFLEKWAVKLGGCENYRFGLYDWIMIKDNHVEASGGIKNAINNVHRYLKDNKLDLNITVEVRNLVELYDALEVGGFKRIMLDNFEIPLLQEAVEIIGNRYETEASGGITINTVRNVAKTGVRYISSGALTHSFQSLDLSLKIVR
ncbi:MAG TPA: carboxylating nicotinate-nucleotide diphosphorylase [Saprospiraceae bacterium]|jgi:nicotinate-nucleotide pyrophosphorylase (carboxylating)|nr:carboxylating nicotinate-nucleotide diphosphorylase [Saprospiraceae bacterium]MCC6688815.1 carboxylating nicotinate-nucleotide diphosphorylase [Saprospiraceae bacterium]HMW74439.1 carboxylating nicotinate-nucleotide diphosphorylase [Saprospiraceae bacterium]HMX82866.1 carboxylating nicotinate-nucleotide diphosphorylase [Saprospiraceae bacterium]HMX85659.1 carboxylating nicotinate-nucleotide diphosphorylase [Saprospiraceae bacterium]